MKSKMATCNLAAGGPVVAVEQLGLQRGEEALGQGVVKAVAGVPIETVTPLTRSARPNASDVYWQPWSE